MEGTNLTPRPFYQKARIPIWGGAPRWAPEPVWTFREKRKIFRRLVLYKIPSVLSGFRSRTPLTALLRLWVKLAAAVKRTALLSFSLNVTTIHRPQKERRGTLAREPTDETEPDKASKSRCKTRSVSILGELLNTRDLDDYKF